MQNHNRSIILPQYFSSKRPYKTYDVKNKIESLYEYITSKAKIYYFIDIKII